MTTTMYAQDNHNRLFIFDKVYGYKGYLVQDIDSIVFRKVEGDVHVDVEYLGFDDSEADNPKVFASFKRSEDCMSYGFIVFDKNTADSFEGDWDIANLFLNGEGGQYYEDYEESAITNFDFEFVPGATYTIVALAYDVYGIPCRSTKVDFHAPEAEIAGKPSVDWTQEEKELKSVKVKMTPNADCKEYYFYLFEKGLAEQQYQEYAAQFGYVCIGDMIKAFCETPYNEEFIGSWNNLKPNKEYELYIQPIDANGNYADMIIANVNTKTIGGEGVATMSIEVKEFGGDAENGYHQHLVFTPNDQCAAHRDMVVYKEWFEDGTYTHESFIEYMKNDKNPDYPDFIDDPYWDIFGVEDANFYVEPGTTYYAYSIGKNINGEYGEPVFVEFTTPVADQAATVKTSSNIKKVSAKRVGTNDDIVLPGGKVIKKHLTLKRIR